MRSLVGWLSLALSASVACGQVKRMPGIPQPRSFLTVGDTVTLSATPATLNITLIPGATAAATSAITITTTWGGISLLSSLTVWASLGSTAAALSGGSPLSSIPSSAVLGMDPSGLPTSFTPFTATSPLGAAAALEIFQTTNILNFSGSHSDSLWLKVNLASLPQLPAATYSGTISFQAQAF